MYLSFFGLNEKPFAITPDPRYLYMSERHAEALAHLLYGINEAGGFVQLTGEVGTGKTTVVRSLLAQTPKNAEVALILNPRMTPPEFLLTICEELGIGVQDAARDSVKDLVDILNHYLLRAHSAGRRVVLVVDEAQNLAPEVLEQVRLLTNLETNTQKLLQIILIGQPELRELLSRNELRQLAQRITGRFHLNPLSADESCAYVRHRLRVAGATTDVFTTGALKEVYRLSGGVPRLINVICDRALLGGYTQDRHRVSSSLVRQAAAEVFGRRIAPRWAPWIAAAASVAVAATGAIALIQFVPWASLGQDANFAAQAEGRPARTDEALVSVNDMRPQPPAPAAAAESAVASGPVPLPSLLARHADTTTPDRAFARLFELWRAGYVAGQVDPCSQAAQQGLECHMERGSLDLLRLYNKPVILMLTDAAGRPHQAVLSRLDDTRARIDLGGQTHEIDIADLANHWQGDFVLLWRPAAQGVKYLSAGMRGEGVRWLRKSLQRASGIEPGEHVSDFFDFRLQRLVMDFQRKYELAVDGVAGAQTQLVLGGAVPDPGSPLLLHAEPTQGS